MRVVRARTDGTGGEDSARRTMLTSGEISIDVPLPNDEVVSRSEGVDSPAHAHEDGAAWPPRNGGFAASRPAVAVDASPAGTLPPPPPFADGEIPALTRSPTIAVQDAPDGDDGVDDDAGGRVWAAAGPVDLDEEETSEPRGGRTILPIVVVVGLCAGFGALVAWGSEKFGRSPVRVNPVTAQSSLVEPIARASEPAVVVGTTTCPTEMVFVSGGKFFMGTDDEDLILANARPARQVQVASFCIDRTEVTLERYRECSAIGECKRAFRKTEGRRDLGSDELEGSEADVTGGATGSKAREMAVAYDQLCNENHEERDDHPVNCVTWEQASAHCAWAGGRLPTEQEWEFAARGSDGRVYSWGDDDPSMTRMNGCGEECARWRADIGVSGGETLFSGDDGYVSTAPVGSFPEGATPLGLVDMAGNVFEWTSGPFVGGAGDGERVIRGGAFDSARGQLAEPAFRSGIAEDTHVPALGFRCAADLGSTARTRNVM